MKILIIDDNIFTQKTLREVLEEAGYTVSVHNSSKNVLEIMDLFKPDLIVLDITIEEGDGVRILDAIHEDNVSKKIDIIVITDDEKKVPKDNAFIRDVVEKPFKSSDVINKVEQLKLNNEDLVEPRKPKKEHSRKKRNKDTDAVKSLHDFDISFGESYVLFQENPNLIQELTLSFKQENYDVMYITSGKKKIIKDRFGRDGIFVVPLSANKKSGYFEVSKLGTMVFEISEFIKSKERPTVVFDNLNTLIDENNKNSVLLMLNQLLTADYNKKFTLLVSVNTQGFNEKDKEILTHQMELYNPSEEKL